MCKTILHYCVSCELANNLRIVKQRMCKTLLHYDYCVSCELAINKKLYTTDLACRVILQLLLDLYFIWSYILCQSMLHYVLHTKAQTLIRQFDFTQKRTVSAFLFKLYYQICSRQCQQGDFPNTAHQGNMRLHNYHSSW